MSILAALAVLASCERKPEFSEVTELGCAQKEAVVDAAGGEAIFSIIASGEDRSGQACRNPDGPAMPTSALLSEITMAVSARRTCFLPAGTVSCN